MKTKHLLSTLVLLACTLCFICCDKDDEEGRKITGYKEYELIVASEMKPGVLLQEGNNLLREVYAVKHVQSQEWESFGRIDDFEFEEGYEYKIRISDTAYLDYSMGEPAWTEYDLLEIISKDKKDSEGLPSHFIPESYYKDRFLPKYRYAVEAKEKGLIEEDLKTSSILPLDYHYLIYTGNKSKEWIAIKNENTILGPCIIESKNISKEELPESYKILRPEGNIAGIMNWKFLNEDGNETSYPSFDAFIGFSNKTKSVGPSPDIIYLYKDLTQHYKDKYPESEVNAVVVSYSIPLP